MVIYIYIYIYIIGRRRVRVTINKRTGDEISIDNRVVLLGITFLQLLKSIRIFVYCESRIGSRISSQVVTNPSNLICV